MGALPRHHAERKPAGVLALAYPDREVTWRELEANANRRARQLASAGVKAGDFVTIALPNGAAFHETTFAVWKLGATPNPVSSRLPMGEASALVELVRPSAIVSDGGDWPAGVPCLAGAIDLAGLDPTPFAEAAPSPHWKAMTSGGSTGRPKVIVDHRPATCDPSTPLLNQTCDGVILNPGPLYHNAPFSSSHMGLMSGATIIGMSRFDAETALSLIERHRVDWVNLVPTMMHRMAAVQDPRRPRYDLSSLRAVWHSAAPIPAWLKERWIEMIGPEKLFELYGGTEGQGYTIIDGVDWLSHRGSVGRLTTPGRIRILRDDGSECPPGEVGEIFFAPEGRASATYHYIGAEPRRGSDGAESLGDLGWLDDEGYLYLADRRTDLILRGGANIYPAEIEAAIDSWPGSASSLVIGLPDEELGQAPHAIVEPRSGRLDVAALHEFLGRALVKYKLPHSYEVSATPLRDDAGKARRSALRAEREARLRSGDEFRISATGLPFPSHPSGTPRKTGTSEQ
jgi:bile acid-coenzyme A ligase